jgi:hypothetical protein
MNYAFASEHIEEGARLVVKYNPEVDPDAAIGASQVASQLCFTEEVTSGKVAVGQFEPERTTKTRDITTEYLQLKQKLPIEDLYTNDLLPEKR